MSEQGEVRFAVHLVAHSKNPGDASFHVVRFTQQTYEASGKRHPDIDLLAIVFGQQGTIALLHDPKDASGKSLHLQFEGTRDYIEPLRAIIAEATRTGKVQDIESFIAPPQDN